MSPRRSCCCGECECPLGDGCCPENTTASIEDGSPVSMDYGGGGLPGSINDLLVLNEMLDCVEDPNITTENGQCWWTGSTDAGGGDTDFWDYLVVLYRLDASSAVRQYTVLQHWQDIGAPYGLVPVSQYNDDREIDTGSISCSLESAVTVTKCYDHPGGPATDPATKDVTFSLTP